MPNSKIHKRKRKSRLLKNEIAAYIKRILPKDLLLIASSQEIKQACDEIASSA